ncbi:DUF2220 domain-containing protein [Niallia taxi]|uniref:DUF2220 domain-containing protein n=1 Tax=Niallia taxi TaxID=2499688 RepID=UPI0021A5C455|nr:DUF2220 domain-containing protein [Niallia taxi]MCT2347107.1 DUF2220 domain-containing protein [Niallia taxi]
MTMSELQLILETFIDYFYDRQGKAKKLLSTDKLEGEIIRHIGDAKLYQELGGYKSFHAAVTNLLEEKRLKQLTKPILNGKKPALSRNYWLLPKHTINTWTDEWIMKLLLHLNLDFYLRHKKHQTEEEGRLIQSIYFFLLEKEKYAIVTREERSLMLFKREKLPDNIEAEKFLASKEGVRLMRRLKLIPEDLAFKVVREPFHYWKNPTAPEAHKQEVLIVEGLSTYHTLKEMMEKGLPWKFGPVPTYLIWGEGYRIEKTISYLQDVTPGKVTDLVIRYMGDLDYEGYNIYFGLKEKNPELNISLAHAFYSFLVHYSDEFATKVHTAQRVVDRYLPLLKGEFEQYEEVYPLLKRLWNDNLRIAQEAINIETILRKGGFS